ncbi:peptidoglycan-N-acetylmuramic acid deacetylase PdaC [Ruminiclostridium hungatei]|uniref:Peptidoglycan-N-acetylmuramic acid deacetylase PdaC n=1 Tax=Ruminiclostridium hungatei TaxID=48256 RepID=A0A1V4SFA6_RUMHU|nr:polysaccharide deacetylase family protein [Ruminiclostridium hungatei]OPX42569.1 peptidoglycan-N-acetylmuramic acid deacetylase PdaC [Ruminiclostridium hungatei]
MKKIIQISLALLIIIFITAGYTSGYVVSEKPVQTEVAVQPAGQPADRQDGSALQEAAITQAEAQELSKQVREQHKTAEQEADPVHRQPTGEAGDKPEDKLEGDRPMVALTFDDGPHPKYTLEILDALKSNNARATFFVLGSRAERYKEVIGRIGENGNEIGNHTYDHRELTKLSGGGITGELSRTTGILEHITGVKPVLTRPTYGSVNEKVRKYAGSPLVLWSIDTLDWKTRDTEKIVHEAMSNVKDGDIILMHDIYKTTAEAAGKIIEKLKARGFDIVTVSDLYKARGISLQNGKEYYRCSPSIAKK